MDMKEYIKKTSNALFYMVRLKKQIGNNPIKIGDKNIFMNDINQMKCSFLHQLNETNFSYLHNDFNLTFNQIKENYNMEDEQFDLIVENFNNKMT